jgi:hypothetical protein
VNVVLAAIAFVATIPRREEAADMDTVERNQQSRGQPQPSPAGD